ncbi:hypothetical protein [Photobacterium ganghwense]|uniref:hypothetical protein n=1 Tax=Photobacterium ganghwense TaxID=320778 RepID=UPI0039EE626E
MNIDGSILSATIEEQYVITANMPIGMRFVVTGKVVVDLYGLEGFSMTRLKGSYNLLNLSSSDKKKFMVPSGEWVLILYSQIIVLVCDGAELA